MSGKISGLTNSQPSSGSQASSASAAGAGQRTATATAPTAASAAPPSTSATGNTSTAASVQITDTASFLAAAEQTLNDVPVIDAGRVAETSDSLSAGTYKISPERIANQLLQFERLLPEEAT